MLRRVVSVEMIEAVGFEFWPAYFATLDRVLAPVPSGLQAITMPHDRMLASRDTYTWIHKYVFPWAHPVGRLGRAGGARTPR